MSDDRISFKDAAQELGLYLATVTKVARQLGIETSEKPSSIQGDPRSMPREGYRKLRTYLERRENGEDCDDLIANETRDRKGYFYLIQLEPEFDPGRFKLGFAVDLEKRLKAHRCSAPFATVLDKWECVLAQEKLAIDRVTTDCQTIHTEVFRTQDSLDVVRSRCDEFFARKREQ